MDKLDFMEAKTFLNEMSDYRSKSAVLVGDIDYKLIKWYRNNIPKLIKENIKMAPYGVCVYSQNFAFYLTKKSMNRLVEAGILQNIYKYLSDFELRPKIDPPKEPYVFKFSDLEFGFVTWLIACGISLLMFIIEIIWYYSVRGVKYLIRQYVGLFLFIKLFRSIKFIG